MLPLIIKLSKAIEYLPESQNCFEFLTIVECRLKIMNAWVSANGNKL